MSKYRRNGKLEYARAAQAQAEMQSWVAWRLSQAELIEETGLPWYVLQSRADLDYALRWGWYSYPLASLSYEQRLSLRFLLRTLQDDPTSVWPALLEDDGPVRHKTPEESWLECEQDRDLDGQALPRASVRQLRLFAAGCCRRHPRFGELDLADAVQTIERYADGQADAVALGLAQQHAREVESYFRRQHDLSGTQGATLVKEAARVHLRANFKLFLELQDSQRASWRELLGNPFRQRRLPAQCLAPRGAVATLARAIYVEGSFDGMPILGDALEELGCRDAEVLAHCRDRTAQHARGCWVLDVLLRPAR